ncbi:MAG: HAMP domain-containing histidine kinase [Rhizobiales bacterium]|nr:HAMP domain-containing histidine kinase [Hyphomicrobiales bacterium]
MQPGTVVAAGPFLRLKQVVARRLQRHPLPPVSGDGFDESPQTVVLPPLLLAANILIAIGFSALAKGHFELLLVLAWTAAACLASLIPALFGLFVGEKVGADRRIGLFFHELSTLMLGLVWAAFPVLFFDSASSDMRLLAVALIFAMSGIGSFTLARVPTSAMLFCALIAGALTLASIKTGGAAGLALGILSLLYGTGIATTLLSIQQAAARQHAAELEIGKQKGIIALLLNDFDKEVSDWLWETGSDGRLTYVSQRLCDGLGLEMSALLGNTLAGAVAAAPDQPGWRELHEAMTAQLAVDGLLLRIAMEGRETWWRIAARPLTAKNGKFIGYQGAAHDVTGDRREEARLIAAKEAAERASASKSQFLAVMSHELRTPLNAIVGFAELLASEQAESLTDRDRADHLRTIIDSSRHLLTLISDILDATRIERGTLRLVEQEADAAEILEVAVKMCRDLAETADTTIVARVIEGIEIKGDITRIKQVLINLITNAVKFSPAGGFVNIAFERTETGGLAIAVRDAGVGIRKEDLDRIFEPFVQADQGSSRRFGGIGLGLSIARKIAEMHGGAVTIESEYGMGTTARLIFPAARIEWPVAAVLTKSSNAA